VAPILVTLLDVQPVLCERSTQRGIVHDHGIGWQIVEQRCRLVEEQRHVELDAGRSKPFADAAIDARLRRVSLETRSEATSETANGFRVQRHLSRRQQAHGFHRGEGALCFWIEAADGFDLIVEQIDAQRLSEPHRKHVEQRTAHGKLARARHLTHARVPRLDEAVAKRFEGERLAHLQLERSSLNVGARRKPLHERVRGDDQASLFRRRQLVERSQAFGCDIRVRRKQVVGQDLPIREGQQAKILAGEEAQLGTQTLQLTRTVGDDDVQARVRAHRLRERERRRTAVELLPAKAALLR
jgi:hypothetical protein